MCSFTKTQVHDKDRKITRITHQITSVLCIRFTSRQHLPTYRRLKKNRAKKRFESNEEMIAETEELIRSFLKEKTMLMNKVEILQIFYLLLVIYSTACSVDEINLTTSA